jgi:hypothetical protein
MKKVILFLSLILCISHISCNMHSNIKQAINPIIGDISFIQKFGYEPGITTDEDLRIKTHFEYVENLLRKRDISHLTLELREKRRQLLNLLHDYYTAGIFPRNYDYSGNREPCFIDKDNRICAVGYLIEKTEGRKIAEQINSRHKYDRILAMNDSMVDSWIETSGLSKEECATIQPTYGPPPTSHDNYHDNYISSAYGISSSVLGGLNLSLNTLNGIQISKGSNHKAIGILGLITGAGQTILGASTFPKTKHLLYGTTSNESRKTLSMVNIGLGTTTLILSAWNLLTNKECKNKKTILHLKSFETPGNNIGMMCTLSRRF